MNQTSTTPVCAFASSISPQLMKMVWEYIPWWWFEGTTSDDVAWEFTWIDNLIHNYAAGYNEVQGIQHMHPEMEEFLMDHASADRLEKRHCWIELPPLPADYNPERDQRPYWNRTDYTPQYNWDGSIMGLRAATPEYAIDEAHW